MSFLLVVWTVYQSVGTPLIPENESPVIITLGKSASATAFVYALKDKKLINSTKPLLSLIRLKHLSHKFKAGVYQINPGETLAQVLDKVLAGEVIKLNFKIIEGTTQKKIAEDLLRAPYLEYNESIWTAYNHNHPNAEGLLLADTYQYHGGSSAKTLLDQAHYSLLKYLDETWEHRADNLPYKTPYELLIAASIIEKETAVPNERTLISGVMLNRLKKHMPLQMDPTVIYALGPQYKGSLTHEDLSVISPYNSYLNKGLPPTPIAMVGKEAIDAAAHPQLSNYLYYVAKGDGTHQFSETYLEQRRAINQFMHRSAH